MGNYKGEIALLCITAIELYALHRGIDGQVLSVVIAAIAGIGGYVLATKKAT